MAKMTPAVIATITDDDWSKRSLTSTAKNSSRTKRAVKGSQILPVGRTGDLKVTTG